MLISPCYLKVNSLKIKNELKGEKKLKFFTVTSSVPSVKSKKSKFTLIRQIMCFYSAVDIVLNTIRLILMCYSEV